MGMSLDGLLVYGIVLGGADDDYISPISEYCEETEDYDFDIDSWWLAQNGYKPHMKLWDDGNYPDPKPPESEYDKDYRIRRRIESKLPFEVEFIGMGDCMTRILVFKDKYKYSSYYDATVINPTELVVSEDDQEILKAFCNKYGFEYTPKWHLGARYW
jgi:hypothetical protein